MKILKPQARWQTKWLRIALAAILVLGVLVARTAADDRTRSAIAAAEAWLKLVDNENYGRSWQTAAALFRKAVDKTQWENALSAGRKPMGKIISRQLTSAKHHKSLPGAPDGDYVVIQYQSRFSGKDAAVETITPLLEKDGQWRVSGYFIR